MGWKFPILIQFMITIKIPNTHSYLPDIFSVCRKIATKPNLFNPRRCYVHSVYWCRKLAGLFWITLYISLCGMAAHKYSTVEAIVIVSITVDLTIRAHIYGNLYSHNNV